jgi:UDP-glucose 4-epimerase
VSSVGDVPAVGDARAPGPPPEAGDATSVAPQPSHAGFGRPRRVVVTGATGYLGVQAVEALAAGGHEVLGVDVRAAAVALPGTRPGGVASRVLDVRDPALADVLAEHRAQAVVHLAAIVEPPPGMSDAEVRDIDVGGTRNVVAACVAAGAEHLTVTSSGAAYGYHPSNAGAWLTEDAPLRGHDRFAYSANKRDVEALLADARREHPQLAQLVLRPGTILGPRTDNLITALFERRLVLDLAGADVPFVFVLDRDVVEVIVRGVTAGRSGVYNLAGDGAVTLAQVARRLRKRRLPIPVPVLRGALATLQPMRLARYGPEQVDFLRYRPVLANDALKRDFPGLPTLTSRQVFEVWARGRGLLPPAPGTAG